MLTSSFQTVIKRYNSNSQEIKINRKVNLTFKSSIYSYAHFVCAQNNFRLTRTKKVFMDYHTIEKEKQLPSDLVIFPH